VYLWVGVGSGGEIFFDFFEGPMVTVSDRHIGGVRTGTASGRPMSARVFGHTPSAQ
jgi:hypothetical protein